MPGVDAKNDILLVIYSSVQELSTNFRSKYELKLDMYRENLVHTSLESSLQELSSDTWFSTRVSESSGLNQPHEGSNDIEWPGDLLDPAKYFERAPSNTTHNHARFALMAGDGWCQRPNSDGIII